MHQNILVAPEVRLDPLGANLSALQTLSHTMHIEKKIEDGHPDKKREEEGKEREIGKKRGEEGDLLPPTKER